MKKLTTTTYDEILEKIFKSASTNTKAHSRIGNLIKKNFDQQPNEPKFSFEKRLFLLLNALKTYKPKDPLLVVYKDYLSLESVSNDTNEKVVEEAEAPSKGAPLNSNFPKPYTIGSYMKNRKGELCKILTSTISPDFNYHEEESFSKFEDEYLTVSYLNLETYETIELSRTRISDKNRWVWKGFDDTTLENYYVNDHHLDGSQTYPEPVNKSKGRLGLKKENIPNFPEKVKIEELKEIIVHVQGVNKEYGLRVETNAESIIAEVLENFKRNHSQLDPYGFIIGPNNKKYVPEIYHIEDIKEFCTKYDLILLTTGLYSIDYLPLEKLQKNEVKFLFIPQDLNNTIIMIKLCLELDKLDSAREATKLATRKIGIYGNEYKQSMFMIYCDFTDGAKNLLKA